MTLYLLSEWEINGYNDSDFECAVWDTEQNEVRCILLGSTRFAGSYSGEHIVRDNLPQDVVEAARIWLRDVYLGRLKAMDAFDRDHPDDIEVNDRVVLTKGKRGHAYTRVQDDCPKCDGSGKWVNPHNDQDVRECFACSGSGSQDRFEKVTVDGKVQWDQFEEGITGTVLWVGTFRQIYDRGYNKRGRNTLSVRVVTDDGRMFTTELSNLRLERDYTSHQELLDRAEWFSYTGKFGAVLNSRYAWDSDNPFLKALYKGDKDA